MIEFKLIKDSVEYVPPSPKELKKYQNLLETYRGDDYWAYHVSYPESTAVHHPVTEEMAGMVEEGWQVHTFSVDNNGVYYALMERETND